MKLPEAKRWLQGEPGARRAVRYLKPLDDIAAFYVPQLCGQDVMLDGEPRDYATESGATAAAQRFQDAIRQNHHRVD